MVLDPAADAKLEYNFSRTESFLNNSSANVRKILTFLMVLSALL